MTALDLALIALGGGIGAGARYLLDAGVSRGRTEAFPLGIALANVLGSFLLGILTGIGTALGPMWLTIGGLGVLGGFTTFGTVSVDTVRWARRGRRPWAWMNGVGTLVATVVAAAIGMALGSLVPR